MFKTFFSYRRKDSKHITGHIYDRLEDHFGRDNVFLDVDDIPSGIDFRSYLEQEVGECNVLLVIIGERWLEFKFDEGPKQGRRCLDDSADFVRIEIESALTRGIPIIPVLIDGARMPSEQELPEGLRGLAYRQAIEVRSGRDFRSHVERLAQAIEGFLRPKQEEARRQAEAEHLAREQEEIRRQAEANRLRQEREEAYQQAETERLRRELEVREWQAEAERLRDRMRCPDCQTVDPVRCFSCKKCFTCLGEKPRWYRKIIFGGAGYNCSDCSAEGMNYHAPG